MICTQRFGLEFCATLAFHQITPPARTQTGSIEKQPIEAMTPDPALAIVAVGVVLWLSRRVGSSVWAVALGLLLAGVTGNLTDRMLREPGPFRGHVIDFLMLPNWPIFNVADMCINVAAGLILVQAFRGIKLDGSRVRTEGPGDD